MGLSLCASALKRSTFPPVDCMVDDAVGEVEGSWDEGLTGFFLANERTNNES